MAVGKLLTASLTGKADDGAQTGDFWNGATKGWLKDEMLKTGLWVPLAADPVPPPPPAKGKMTKKEFDPAAKNPDGSPTFPPLPATNPDGTPLKKTPPAKGAAGAAIPKK